MTELDPSGLEADVRGHVPAEHLSEYRQLKQVQGALEDLADWYLAARRNPPIAVARATAAIRAECRSLRVPLEAT